VPAHFIFEVRVIKVRREQNDIITHQNSASFIEKINSVHEILNLWFNLSYIDEKSCR
jgi:hypothetical protein